MPAAEAQAFVVRAMAELTQSAGFQILLGGFHSVEANALAALRVGLRPDFQLGRIAAFEQLRDYLRQLKAPLPQLEAEAEEDLLSDYESGFLVKPLTQAEQVPPADLSHLPEESAD